MEILLGDDEVTRAFASLRLARAPIRSLAVRFSDAEPQILMRAGLGPLSMTLAARIDALEVTPEHRLSIGFVRGLGRTALVAGVRRMNSRLVRWDPAAERLVVDVPRIVPFARLVNVGVAGRAIRLSALLGAPDPR